MPCGDTLFGDALLVSRNRVRLVSLPKVWLMDVCILIQQLLINTTSGYGLHATASRLSQLVPSRCLSSDAHSRTSCGTKKYLSIFFFFHALRRHALRRHALRRHAFRRRSPCASQSNPPGLASQSLAYGHQYSFSNQLLINTTSGHGIHATASRSSDPAIQRSKNGHSTVPTSS